MNRIKDIINQIKVFANSHDKLYLYGAGKYGRALLIVLKQLEIPLEGICVSVLNERDALMGGLPVVAYYEVSANHKGSYHYGFILAMKEKWQREVLEEHGAEVYQDFLSVPVSFFLEIECYLKNCIDRAELSFSGWINKCLSLLKENCLLLRREGGIGDILALEPVLRYLKKAGYVVVLETEHQELFYWNSSVDLTFKWNCTPELFENRCLVFDLTYAHEFYPHMHLTDGYMACIRKLLKVPFIKDEDRIPCYAPLLKCKPKKIAKKICINNEATGWNGRIYSKNKMKKFALYLKSNDYELYEIGSKEENYLGVGKNCYGLALEESMKLMANMDLYVGLDNGLMHLAQSIQLPIFVLFGCTCPNYRIYDWSRARVLWKNVDELSCAACHHRRCIPCGRTVCSRDKVYCMDWSVEEVIEAFETKKYNDPPILKKEMYSPIKFFENDEVAP